METVTNAATGVVNVASNVATNVASVASQAIWGDASKKENTTKTTGKEPVSGEVGDVKSGEPYDKGNEDAATTSIAEPKSRTKTNSTEISSADSSVDLTSASTSKPGEPAIATTETLATTQIEPLVDAKKDPENVSVGGASLAQQVKTGSGGTDSTGVGEGLKSLSLKENDGKPSGITTTDSASKSIGATEIEPLKKETAVPATTSSSITTPATTSSTTTTPSKTTTSASDSKDEKEHKSLKEKIKEKLHHKKH